MAKQYIYLLSFLFSVLIYGQSKDQNYVLVTECIEDDNCNKKINTIRYFDGLGREIQSIIQAPNTTIKPILTHLEYDELGREVKRFLPVPVNANTINFQSSVGESSIKSFYNNLYGNDGNFPFAETKYENSNLNRVEKQSAPGEDWKMNGGHEIKYEYLANSWTNDRVRKFSATTTWDTANQIYSISFHDKGDYESNVLYKNVTKNENWKSTDGLNNTTEEYTNVTGQKILVRTYNNGQKVDTYYIYDIYGNLTYVLPPKLSEKGTITSELLNELGYQYKYDKRNRLVEKKEPGKEWEFIVYDKQDRVAFTQSANQKSIEWTFTRYDNFDRVVYTGLYTSTQTRSALQKEMDKAATKLNETKSTRAFSNNGTSIFYSNQVYPASNIKVLLVNYYDNYTGVTTSFPTITDNQIVNEQTSKRLKGLPIATFVNQLGTTKWDKTISYYEKKYLQSVANETFYNNNTNSYTKVHAKLGYTGSPIKSTTFHKKDASTAEIKVVEEYSYDGFERPVNHYHTVNNNPRELLKQNVYDQLGQLSQKKVGRDVSNPHQLVDFKYNIRGWLTDINNVDEVFTGDYKDLFSFKISYNKKVATNANTADNQYNGNISQVFWKTPTSNQKRSYDFTYDHLNRLLNANYSRGGDVKFAYDERMTYDSNGNILTLNRYGQSERNNGVLMDELTYYYQPNSNKLLNVNDNRPQLGFLDKNKSTSTDPQNHATNDYKYDAAGNLKQDLNKDITEIKYNHLNLPTEVLWTNGNKIVYTYDASGIKLNKTVTEGSKTTTTEYIGGFQYEQNKLQFFPHAEGYVNVLGNLLNDNKTFHYVYNYADHLGNVRVSYAWDERGKLEILEENHYYPFGLKHRGYTDLVQVPVEIGVGVGVEPGGIGVISTDYSGSRSYNYKYNGKELEDDLGLDWYAMDMRMYDPTIARWMVQDPVVHHGMSPYNAFDNNPVYWADPSGADSQGGGDESNIGDTKMAFGVTAGQLGQVSKIEYWSASGDTSSGRGPIKEIEKETNINHTWKSEDKINHHVGTDILRVVEKETVTIKDSETGKVINKEILTTTYFITVNKNGKISEVGVSKHYENVISGFKTMLKGDVKNINEVNSNIRGYANGLSDYKLTYDKASPLQATAYNNMKSNENIQTTTSVSKAVGTIVSKIPAPNAKIIGVTINSGSAIANFFLTKPSHAENVQVNVKF